MGATIRDISPDEIRAFRERHGIKTQVALDHLFGAAASKGRGARRWEADGAPPYVAIILGYADAYGLDLLKEVVAKKLPGVSADDVIAFRARHEIKRQAELDWLMGFKSAGRATRAWEKDGAPSYLAIIFAYADAHGLDLMRQKAAQRDEAAKAAAEARQARIDAARARQAA